MREPRIYLDLALQIDLILSLPESASHHIGRVLRMRPGQHIWLFNGLGGSYRGEIVSIGKHHAQVSLLEFRHEELESNLKITLAQGISRSHHMDYCLQKAVELGVSRIVPIKTEFGNVSIKDNRAEKKRQHWQQIIISACEQCGRNLVPELSAPLSLAQWLREDANSTKLLLHPGAAHGISSMKNREKSLTILSGPEGGFSSSEVESAITGGYLSVELGPRILRTETAAIAALSICQSLWGDMS